MSAYISAAYILVFITCLMGAFSRIYAATIVQRISLAIFGMWCVSRIYSINFSGYWIHKEYALATALLLLAGGTFLKTYCYTGEDRRTREIHA